MVDVSPLTALLALKELFVKHVSAVSLQHLAHLPLRKLTIERLKDSERLDGVLPRMSSTLRKLTLDSLQGSSILSSVAELQGLHEVHLSLVHELSTLKPVGQL